MKIMLFSQFYPPETTAGAFRVAEHARLWAARGNEVSVFTGYPNYPKGKLYDGYTIRRFERIDGDVTVFRSRIRVMDNRSFVRRLLGMGSFLFWGAVNVLSRGREIGRADIAIATSGPVFCGLLGLLYARRERIPFVFEVRDITYRQMLATGTAEGSLSYKMMKGLELWLCRRADRVVCLTEGFKRTLVGDGIAAGSICVIRNGADIPGTVSHAAPEDAVTLSYYGTVGISQGVEQTVSYFARIRAMLPASRYTIIGDGAGKPALLARCEGEAGVTVRPALPEKALAPWYAQTNLAVVVLHKSVFFADTIPSKLFQIMGRGIAVLFIGPEGEAASILRQSGAGIVLTGTQAEDFAALDAFFSARDWAARLREMGEKGLAAARERFSRRALADAYLDVLLQTVKACGQKG